MKSMRINQAFSRSQHGLTLVEMMVAMTIGLVLLGGVITVLTASQQTCRVNEAMARMQENARYAFQLLSRDIRMAGYRGCVGDVVAITNVLNNKNDFLWRFDQPLEGFEATSASGWTPALPSEVTSPLKGGDVGRDVIVVRGVEDSYARVISHASESADPGVELGSDFGKELQKYFDKPPSNSSFIVLASNCQGITVFQATGVSNVSGQKIIAHASGSGEPNTATMLGRSFTGGEVVRISTRIYYIRTNPGGIPALYWKRGSEKAEELVEGIENMQIQYGEDTDGDRAVDTYRTADLVADWENVVSVRIDLLVQSVEDNVTSQSQTYTFNGETVTPTDRRLRQVFSTVISLRNRAP
ncbi:type IV pilus assembly protein PilW [Nitrosomonas eutropha]|uniref:PilW family protein n=1 Tax=Nitrosomonas eutropha TaxID=916 RepID=UPI0008806F9C|nr:PilW family protein [Nitrosomonas eutropha]SCX25116.1 type IV pilus assembly protein PilW [Nitrosomonas eutropha]